jgi:protein involved in polysaccharide export with SLBB domain
MLAAAVAPAAAQLEGGLGPAAGSVSSAAYYYISKTGEITMSINLWGLVQHPGRYEVPISTDLVQLISFAGGPMAEADMGEVKITRTERREDEIRRVEFTLNLKSLERLDSQSLSLRPGDTIYIERVAFNWPDVFTVLTTASTIAIAVASVISLSR